MVEPKTNLEFEPFQANPEPSSPVRFLLGILHFYQRRLSRLWHLAFGPWIGCRFYPTCSHYACECLVAHGAFKGTGLALWRVLRCSPLSKGGFDPVPPRRQSPSCHRA